jgi:glucose-6-phosphate isomerase
MQTQDMLFDLAAAAGLEDKRTKMGCGQHINATEDRAGTHTVY